jgi:hypothetical protein
MKILIPICFLIYFNPLLGNESEDLHYTLKIFKNPHEMTIKKINNNTCINKDDIRFKDVPDFILYESIEECENSVEEKK